MAKNSIRDFDATSSNNTDIQSVNIAEGCSPAGINNAIRELMADIKDVSAGTVALESPQADSLTVTGDLTVDTDTLFVDASADKVAMGTTSADADASVLSIKGTDPAQIYDGQIIIHGSATSGAADTGAGIGFKGHHGTGNRNLGAIQSLKENATSGNADAYMRFVTRSNSGGLAEVARLDSSGNLNLGDVPSLSADQNLSGQGQVLATSLGGGFGAIGISVNCGSYTSAYAHMRFYNGNGLVGNISTSGSSTTYSTSSDYRLKENVTNITDGITRLKQLNPSRFNFIADDSTTVDGFLAHEAATVVPEAVTGTHNETEAIGDITDGDSNVVKTGVVEPNTLEDGFTWTETGTRPVYQGIDQSKLVPLLTAALQEAITKIETLETKVTALENA